MESFITVQLSYYATLLYFLPFIIDLQAVNTVALIKFCYHRIEEAYACAMVAKQN